MSAQPEIIMTPQYFPVAEALPGVSERDAERIEALVKALRASEYFGEVIAQHHLDYYLSQSDITRQAPRALSEQSPNTLDPLRQAIDVATHEIARSGLARRITANPLLPELAKPSPDTLEAIKEYPLFAARRQFNYATIDRNVFMSMQSAFIIGVATYTAHRRREALLE